MKHLMLMIPKWRCSSVKSSNWTVSFNPVQPNPDDNVLTCGPHHSEIIKAMKPDVVVYANLGCTEREFDEWDKPQGPKYITWSTDSYRHTQRCTTSDLHLSSIPDTVEKSDIFVPLWHDHHMRPNLSRDYTVGMCARPHMLGNRQELIADAQAKVNGLHLNQSNIHVGAYIDEIKRYRYGLNISIYPNGLPNFRNFELGACGVMPVCKRQVYDLSALFDGHIRLYDHIEEVNHIVEDTYHAESLQEYYQEKHSLMARLRYIMGLVGEDFK